MSADGGPMSAEAAAGEPMPMPLPAGGESALVPDASGPMSAEAAAGTAVEPMPMPMPLPAGGESARVPAEGGPMSAAGEPVPSPARRKFLRASISAWLTGGGGCSGAASAACRLDDVSGAFGGGRLLGGGGGVGGVVGEPSGGELALVAEGEPAGPLPSEGSPVLAGGEPLLAGGGGEPLPARGGPCCRLPLPLPCGPTMPNSWRAISRTRTSLCSSLARRSASFWPLPGGGGGVARPCLAGGGGGPLPAGGYPLLAGGGGEHPLTPLQAAGGEPLPTGGEPVPAPLPVVAAATAASRISGTVNMPGCSWPSLSACWP